jgi:hypothetical protein
MPKKTALDDNASIYQPKKEQTEREKLRGMTSKERFDYLWEYYRKPAFVILAVLVFFIYFIYTIVRPTVTTVFSAALIDSTISSEALDDCEKDFASYLRIDSKKENVLLNSDYYLKAGDSNSMSMQSSLVAHLAAKEIDVIIAPESSFQSYVKQDMFVNLSDWMPTDLCNSLSDSFFIAKPHGALKTGAYGINLTGSALFGKNTNHTDPYILGVVGNSQHKKNTVKFLRYLFHLYS